MAQELASKNAEELIAKLRQRYEIGKSQTYKRLSYLGIKSHKENGEVFLDAAQLEEMDKLDEHLKSGSTMEEYEISGKLVHANSSVSVEQYETLHAEQVGNNTENFDALVRAAQEKAAGNLIAQNLLASEFIANPNLLDEDLKEVVERSEEAARPKALDPMKYAQELLRQRKQQINFASPTTSA